MFSTPAFCSVTSVDNANAGLDNSSYHEYKQLLDKIYLFIIYVYVSNNNVAA